VILKPVQLGVNLAPKGSYISPRKAEVTLALRGLICNQKTADVGRVGVPLNSTQRPENEVDTLWVRVEDCPMIPKKNYLMLNRLTLG